MELNTFAINAAIHAKYRGKNRQTRVGQWRHASSTLINEYTHKTLTHPSVM